MTVDPWVLYVSVAPSGINRVKPNPAIIETWIRLFVFRNDDNRRPAYGHSGVLVRRGFNTTRHHEPNVDMITHIIRPQRLKQPVRKRVL